MRTAREVLEELTSHVMPPRGIAIEIKEMPSKESKSPNWVAKVSAMNSDRTQLFSEKVSALRKSDRLIGKTRKDNKAIGAWLCGRPRSFNPPTPAPAAGLLV